MLGAYTGSTSVKSGLKWPWLCCSCVKFCSVDCDIFVYLHVTGSAGIFLGTFFFFFCISSSQVKSLTCIIDSKPQSQWW